MKIRTIASLGALMVAGLAVSAAAQPAAWTGFYLGLHGNYAFQTSDAATTTVFSSMGYFSSSSIPAIEAAGVQAMSPGGIGGGAQAGFLFQSGAFVIGVEADFGLAGGKDTLSTTAIYPCCAPTNFTIKTTVSNSWMLTARPRIGVAAGNLLIYGTGGLALTNMDYAVVFTDTFASASENGGVTKTLTGLVFGGGFEYRTPGVLSIRAEFLYANFGEVTATSTNFKAFSLSWPMHPFTHTANLKGAVVRVGANFWF